MRKIKLCYNNCIFCFVDQLPDKLRQTLYVKDDDYLLSFTDGNFITLTNASSADLRKIIKYRLEPLYVSVHSMDEKIRDIIFSHKKNMAGLKNLRMLDGNNIKTNIQIVLCPEINDGPDLIDTLSRLLTEFINIISVGIVPVGITRFNSRKGLKPFNKKNSIKTIESVNILKTNNILKDPGRIYLSDEFYILAGIDLPAYKSYGDFYQLENGIGKSSDFLKQARDAAGSAAMTAREKRSTGDRAKKLIVTSEYGEVIIKRSLDILRSNKNITKKELSFFEILVIRNIFFGGNIKSTGLMTGSDIISNLGKIELNRYDKILIPDSIFNADGQTLDNFSRKQIEGLNKNIKIIPEDGKNFIKQLLGQNAGR